MPLAFSNLCDEYTKTGFRVIAIAIRKLSENEIEFIDDESEEFFYTGLSLVGIIVFENSLKPETASMIKELKACNISTAIISGDNEYSCAYNAYKIGIIEPNEPLYFINYIFELKQLKVSKIRYKDGNLNTRELEVCDNDLMGYLAQIFNDINEQYSMGDSQLNISHNQKSNVVFSKPSIRSKEYHFMLNNNSIEFLKNENFLESNILEKTRVFARMIPSSKAEVLSVYKSIMKYDHRVAFVGDGSNDIKAMKVADVGVSFLGCEASISAGFCIPFERISKLPIVFAEGKACLEICVELFKYICFYSLCQFASCLILYLKNLDFSNGMYYLMDLLIIIPLSIFMCFHGSNKLVGRYPVSTLFTKPVILNLFGHWIIFLISGLLTMFKLQEIANSQNYDLNSLIFAMFLICYVDLVLISICFTKSAPFRISIFNNSWLVGHLTICIAIFMYISYGRYIGLVKESLRWFDDLFGVG